MHDYEKLEMNFEPRVNEKKIQEATVLPENVYHSYLGEYFLGQTVFHIPWEEGIMAGAV